MKREPKFFVTIGAKPYGGSFIYNKAEAISLAEHAKAELPKSDVVAWCQSKGDEPFEIWENGAIG